MRVARRRKFSSLLSLLLARTSRQNKPVSGSRGEKNAPAAAVRLPVFRRVVPSAADGPIAPHADASPFRPRSLPRVRAPLGFIPRCGPRATGRSSGGLGRRSGVDDVDEARFNPVCRRARGVEDDSDPSESDTGSDDDDDSHSSECDLVENVRQARLNALRRRRDDREEIRRQNETLERIHRARHAEREMAKELSSMRFEAERRHTLAWGDDAEVRDRERAAERAAEAIGDAMDEEELIASTQRGAGGDGGGARAAEEARAWAARRGVDGVRSERPRRREGEDARRAVAPGSRSRRRRRRRRRDRYWRRWRAASLSRGEGAGLRVHSGAGPRTGGSPRSDGRSSGRRCDGTRTSSRVSSAARSATTCVATMTTGWAGRAGRAGKDGGRRTRSASGAGCGASRRRSTTRGAPSLREAIPEWKRVEPGRTGPNRAENQLVSWLVRPGNIVSKTYGSPR